MVRAIVIPMNYEKRGPWPISSVNSFFSGCSP